MLHLTLLKSKRKIDRAIWLKNNYYSTPINHQHDTNSTTHLPHLTQIPGRISMLTHSAISTTIQSKYPRSSSCTQLLHPKHHPRQILMPRLPSLRPIKHALHFLGPFLLNLLLHLPLILLLLLQFLTGPDRYLFPFTVFVVRRVLYVSSRALRAYPLSLFLSF